MKKNQMQDYSIVGHTLTALESLNNKDEEIQRLQDERKQQRADMIAELGKLLAEVPREQALDVASDAYWADSQLADVVKRAYVLATGRGLFPHPFPTEIPCEWCGNLITATSWTDYNTTYANAQRRQERYWATQLCHSCDTRKQSEDREKQATHSKAYREQWEAKKQEYDREMAELQVMSESEYFETKHWQLLAQAVLKKVGYCCQLCNTGGVLSVHLRSQESRGCETLADLVVLCQNCSDSFQLIEEIRHS